MIRVSHSQLDDFTTCPQKWAFRKVLHAPAAPSENLVFGTAVHFAIEQDGLARVGRHPSGVIALPLVELQAIFRANLRDTLAIDDPHGLLTDRRHAMEQRGYALLRTYHREVAPHYQPVAVESDFNFTIDDDITFSGRIDGVTERNGVRTIIDWKTAGKPWQPGAADGKDQATAYSIARPDAQRVTFIVFASSPEPPYTCTVAMHSTTRNEVARSLYRDKVRRVARQMQRARETGEFPAATGPLCGWCGHLGSCSAGLEWLRDHGKVAQVPVLSVAVTA